MIIQIREKLYGTVEKPLLISGGGGSCNYILSTIAGSQGFVISRVDCKSNYTCNIKFVMSWMIGKRINARFFDLVIFFIRPFQDFKLNS